MPCNSPFAAYRRPGGGISFGKDGYRDRIIMLPCGGCIGCRLDRALGWTVRCLHEAQQSKHCCFLTLTYNELSTPATGTLVKRDLQLFWKRFRKAIAPTTIRYFAVGEYGPELERPHYHALVFGYDFTDKKIHSRRNGYALYRSPTLERLWTAGFSTIGALTFETAAYCARYCLKKITGDLAAEHYGAKLPEFMTCSLRPAIGKTWLEQFKTDVYPHDYVVTRGKERKVPKYYDKQLDELELEQIKRARISKAKRITEAGMAARELIAWQRFATASRDL